MILIFIGSLKPFPTLSGVRTSALATIALSLVIIFEKLNPLLSGEEIHELNLVILS
jgi:hypothetical protein